MTSRTLCGMASLARLSTPAEAPRRRGGAPISPTKSGLPSVSSCSAATSSGEANSDAVSSTYSATSSSLSPLSEEAAGHRLAGDLGQHRGQRLSGDRVDIPVGAEQEHSGRAQLAREELQEKERRRIGRVEIVEDEHDRPGFGSVSEELGGCVEETEASSFGIERGRLRQVGEVLSQLGDDLGEIRRAGSELERSAAVSLSRT